MTYRGAWLLVDYGYQSWLVTISPLKSSTHYDGTPWSKWLESMRNDVDVTFGILKGHWRILNSGIRLHSDNTADNIWKTCFTLHNILLLEDVFQKNGMVTWGYLIQKMMILYLLLWDDYRHLRRLKTSIHLIWDRRQINISSDSNNGDECTPLNTMHVNYISNNDDLVNTKGNILVNNISMGNLKYILIELFDIIF